MSFSSEVKEELARLTSGARHCKIAELAGILNFCGEVRKRREAIWSRFIRRMYRWRNGFLRC